MKPDEVIHPLVAQTIRRYHSYGWNSARIMSMIRAAFGIKMSKACLERLIRERDCGRSCRSVCPFSNYIM